MSKYSEKEEFSRKLVFDQVDKYLKVNLDKYFLERIKIPIDFRKKTGAPPLIISCFLNDFTNRNRIKLTVYSAIDEIKATAIKNPELWRAIIDFKIKIVTDRIGETEVIKLRS